MENNEKQHYDDANDDDAKPKFRRSLLCESNVLRFQDNKFKDRLSGGPFLVRNFNI